MDLDIGLAVAPLEDGRYRTVAERLRSAGFVQDTSARGHPTRQRWRILGRGRVTVDFLMWKDLATSDPEDTSARAALRERVNEEDRLATTELARTMRSRKAPRGPLSPFEKTIAQFYRYLGRTLARYRLSSGAHVRPA